MHILKHGNGDEVMVANDANFKDRRIARMRAKRNNLLALSDNTIVPDRPISESKLNEWKTYRQALRDIDFSDPENITWPDKPE